MNNYINNNNKSNIYISFLHFKFSIMKEKMIYCQPARRTNLSIPHRVPCLRHGRGSSGL